MKMNGKKQTFSFFLLLLVFAPVWQKIGVCGLRIFDRRKVAALIHRWETQRGGVGRRSIGAQNSWETQSIGRFAVAEYNNRQKSFLEFGVVVKVNVLTLEAVGAGKVYVLTLEAVDAGRKVNLYEAIVLVKPWMNFKELQEFKPTATFLHSDSVIEGYAAS